MINHPRWSHLPGYRVVIGKGKGSQWNCGGRVICRHHSDLEDNPRPKWFQWYDQHSDIDTRRWILNDEIHSWLVDHGIRYKFDMDVAITISQFGFEIYEYIWIVIIDDKCKAMLTKLTWGVV